MTLRTLTAAILAVGLAATPAAAVDPAVKMVETFDDLNVYQVHVRVTISGRLVVPAEGNAAPRTIALSGTSNLKYDERALASEDPAEKKVVRAYREVEFDRTIGDQVQKATIRDGVRRMVVLRSAAGRKAPFSPDGPLTYGEIDVVKNDLFSPTLVTGLLPAQPVKPGDKWAATPAAVTDLTDLDKIDSGGLTVEYVGEVVVDGRKHAKLTVGGTVAGVNEDGPNRQKLNGLAYFDLLAGRLSYLKLAGTHEMLGPDGRVTGTIEGSFVLERKASDQAGKLAADALKGLELKPTDDNSLLLYDNPDLGVKFLYPRRWRVGIVQGRQVTLDEPKGGGILFTVSAANETPTPQAFQADVKAFLAKQKAKVTRIPEPTKFAANPAVERFGLDAELDSGKARLEYAVVTTPTGGATMAARLPEKLAEELKPDLDRILKGITVNKPAK